jgi:hypothetical protein
MERPGRKRGLVLLVALWSGLLGLALLCAVMMHGVWVARRYPGAWLVLLVGAYVVARVLEEMANVRWRR